MDEKQFKILTEQLNEIIQTLGTGKSKYVPPSKREEQGETLHDKLTRMVQALEVIVKLTANSDEQLAVLKRMNKDSADDHDRKP